MAKLRQCQNDPAGATVTNPMNDTTNEQAKVTLPTVQADAYFVPTSRLNPERFETYKGQGKEIANNAE